MPREPEDPTRNILAAGDLRASIRRLRDSKIALRPHERQEIAALLDRFLSDPRARAVALEVSAAGRPDETSSVAFYDQLACVAKHRDRGAPVESKTPGKSAIALATVELEKRRAERRAELLATGARAAELPRQLRRLITEAKVRHAWQSHGYIFGPGKRGAPPRKSRNIPTKK